MYSTVFEGNNLLDPGRARWVVADSKLEAPTAARA
jgi:hypothetical protein